MKKTLVSLALSIILLLGLAAGAQAGDFVIAIDYQDLGSTIGIGDIVEWDGSGNSIALDAQYFFTPQFSLEFAYARGTVDHNVLGLAGLDYTSDTYALQLNYLFPLTEKFSLGGFVGYKSFEQNCDGWIDLGSLYSGSANDLYNVKMTGAVIGLKMVYKPTDQFTLESSVSEIISPDMKLKILGYEIPDIYYDDAQYYQFDITGNYWITPSFALRAGYNKIWTGFDVPLGSGIEFDRTYDGFKLGAAFKF